jgi:hypothetical protein
MLFNVTGSASYTPPSGVNATYNTYVMAFVQATVSGDTAYYPIPIAYYSVNPGGGGVYQASSNNCVLTATGYLFNSTPNYCFAVPYATVPSNTQNATASTTQVGIYPSDICFLYASNKLTVPSTVGAECTGQASNGTGAYAPQAGQTQGFSIKFYIVQIPNTLNQINNPQTTSDTGLNGSDTGHINLTSDQSTLFLSFQDQGGSITSCPNQLTQQLYFPGDQSIYLNTQLFQSNFTSPSLSGTGRIAPANSVLMTSATTSTATATGSLPPATPALTNAGFNTNQVLARGIPFGNTTQLVTGFTNSTETTDLYYNLAIFLRDNAGYVTTNACPLDNVKTAEVQGFLNSSKCFIATAAFRSMDAAPVAMLREFRDEVLLRFDLGRGFVNWYYSWSPPAAEWLIDHPGFRYPVLLALVPVEIVAWLCLRPIFFLLLAGMGIALAVVIKKRWAEAPQGDLL